MFNNLLNPKQRRWLRIALIVVPILAVAYIAFHIWFYKYGIGEYIDSPNGQYTADLNRFYERTLFDGEIEFVRARVIEKATRKTIWAFEYKPANTSNLYHYGVRGRTFIRWNTASDQVIFPLDQSGKEIIVPMP